MAQGVRPAYSANSPSPPSYSTLSLASLSSSPASTVPPPFFQALPAFYQSSGPGPAATVPSAASLAANLRSFVNTWEPDADQGEPWSRFLGSPAVSTRNRAVSFTWSRGCITVARRLRYWHISVLIDEFCSTYVLISLFALFISHICFKWPSPLYYYHFHACFFLTCYIMLLSVYVLSCSTVVSLFLSSTCSSTSFGSFRSYLRVFLLRWLLYILFIQL